MVFLFLQAIHPNFQLRIFYMDLESVFNFWGFGRDSGIGVSIIGYFKNFIDLLSFLILLYIGLKVLNLGCLTRFLNWFSVRNWSTCKCNLMSFLNISSPPIVEKWKVVKETVNGRFHEKSDDDKPEQCDADQVFDIMTLRRLVKTERQRANDALLELEKERIASTTAAKEAMALILRLQNQKSVLEMEAQQHQRLTHEKQLHDQEVIQSLRWIVMKHESERSILEDRLRLYKQRLKMYQNYDGEDGSEWISGSLSRLDALDEGLVSSLDLGLSPW